MFQGSSMSLSHENSKQRLRDVIITAVRHSYYGVVEKAVEENNKFEEKYNRFPPTTGDLLDFCDMRHDLPKEMVMIWLSGHVYYKDM